MHQAFICDAIRTPFGRYGGALSGVRADDLGAIPIKALMERNAGVDWAAVTDVLYGCANQAGEDNRNRELDVISNGLKALAMDLQIGVVVLSQMSRKADESYHHPTMTYLRDSGAIEAAADQIALLFTDHAHPMSTKQDNFKGYSQLEIVAHRNGGTGVVPLHFIGQYQQMNDWDGQIPSRSTGKQMTRGMD